MPSADSSRRNGEPPARDLEPRADVALAPFTTLAVGGAARWYCQAESAADVARAAAWAHDHGLPLFVLGGGSNVVMADSGIDALVLHMCARGMRFQAGGAETRLEVGAGESWDAVVAAAVERDLGGLECLSGIPGTTGGTPIQNVGAYGQEVADTIESVVVYDCRQGSIGALAAAECGFAYRMSRFKREDARRFVVCAVTFRLVFRPPQATYPDLVRQLERDGVRTPTLADVRRAVLEVRRSKGMVVDAADPDSRSVGSFFMNPVVDAGVRDRVSAIAGVAAPGFQVAEDRVKIPAAWLIERAGYRRGHVDGAVGLSGKHTLAIVNRGGATARDVLRLATRIKRAVLERFDLALRPEPVFVGFEDDAAVSFLQSEHGAQGSDGPARSADED